MSQQLLEIARNIITKSEKINVNLPNFWNNVDAGAFVTSYKHLPPISANVWCCMSNGKYDLPGLAVDNVIESSRICSTKDSRIDVSITPKAFEICLFVPKHLWINLGEGKIAVTKMQRSLQRAFLVTDEQEQQAVYLPDVWNEYASWSAKDLLNHLADKAKLNFTDITVYEIPCCIIADNLTKDRGFFATTILQRAWNFYNNYKKENLLAYSVSKTVDYDNQGARVRSFSDVQAYYMLGKLLQKDTVQVVEFALRNFECKEPSALAAKIMLQNEIKTEINYHEVEQLLRADSLDYSFEKPQVIIALCISYQLLKGRQFLSQRQAIQQSVANYLLQTHIIQQSFKKNGAFAANWYLQAVASAKKTKWSCLSTSCMIFDNFLFQKAVSICQDALKFRKSITEEACAAHGLLVSDKFDNEKLFYEWAELQYTWKMNGGFRYYVEQDWYRTDVTSHIVQVCFLRRTNNRNLIQK